MAPKSKTRKATPVVGILPSLIIVLLLSLATWLFFQSQSLPLNAPATTVVTGVWFLIVLLAKAIWVRFHKKRA